MIERLEHSERFRAGAAIVGHIVEGIGFVILLIFLLPAVAVGVFWVWFVLSMWFGIPSPYHH